MGLRIQNNIAALNAQRNLGISDSAMSKSLERLSSGYRINSAKDDAAGLAISQQFRADIASYKVASRNVTEANALLQVTEGAMDQIGNMLTRLKELATQAASANAGSNLDKINAEGNKLIDEIDRIANSTKYAGTNLLNGTFGVTLSSGTWTVTNGRQTVSGMASNQTYNVAVVSTATGVRSMTVSATLTGGRYSETVFGLTAPGVGATKEVSFNTLGLTMTLNSSFAVSAGTIVSHTATASNFQVGTSSSGNDKIGLLIGNVTSAVIANGAALQKGQMLSATTAQTFLDTLNTAISYLSGKRGDIGAAQNRLSYASANLASTIENFTAADSVIRDVDMAAEMTTFTKNQILLQAGTAMLAQANSAPQQILSLFK